MKLTLRTNDGKKVELATAMLLEVTNAPGGEPDRAEYCAVVDVEEGLTAVQTEKGRPLPTKIGIVVCEGGAFGVVHVLYGSTLVVTALDLAEAAAQALMCKAPKQGFALAVVGEGVQTVIRVPAAHLQAEIAHHGMVARRASKQFKAEFMVFVLRRLGDAAGLDSLGLLGTSFDRVLLSFASASDGDADDDKPSAGACASTLMH